MYMYFLKFVLVIYLFWVSDHPAVVSQPILVLKTKFEPSERGVCELSLQSID